MTKSVPFWYFLISLKASEPGLYLLFLLISEAGAFFVGSFSSEVFLTPLTERAAVLLVLAIGFFCFV